MKRTDTELLDGLEEDTAHGGCPGIINDDNGHWAVTGDGLQNVVCGDEPSDVQTTFYVQAKNWRKTIREAIDAYLDGDPEDVDPPQASEAGVKND